MQIVMVSGCELHLSFLEQMPWGPPNFFNRGGKCKTAPLLSPVQKVEPRHNCSCWKKEKEAVDTGKKEKSFKPQS